MYKDCLNLFVLICLNLFICLFKKGKKEIFFCVCNELSALTLISMKKSNLTYELPSGMD